MATDPQITWDVYLLSMPESVRPAILDWMAQRPAIAGLMRRYPPGSVFIYGGTTKYLVGYSSTGVHPAGLLVSAIDPREDYDGANAAREFVCVDHL